MSNNLAFETGSTIVVTQPAKHRIILVEWHAILRISLKKRDPGGTHIYLSDKSDYSTIFSGWDPACQL